jgi:hypothetical protein
MVTAYALALSAAETFADLLLAAFDTHRWRLYESREHEKASGEALTRFIQRGL